MTAEHDRLEAARRGDAAWKKWGPYLSERQWGTVREDYSADGNAWHPELGEYQLHCEGAPTLLFTENETNNARLFNGENASPYVKDTFDDYLIHDRRGAVNPAGAGTKCAADYAIRIEAGKAAVIRVRLTAGSAIAGKAAFKGFDELVAARASEADGFYSVETDRVAKPKGAAPVAARR